MPLRYALLTLTMTLVASLGLFASIGVPTSDAARIFACVNKKTGAMRVVDKGTTCRKHERKIRWGSGGSRGPQGPAGPQGPSGNTGPQGPSSYAALGPVTITPNSGIVTLYDLGYGVRLQIQCVGGQSSLTPQVIVNNVAENTYLSSFSAAASYAPPILTKMATVGSPSSVVVSAPFASSGTASVSSQVFVSVLQLADTSAPRVFYATILPWAEAQTTTCKFAGGLTRVAG